MEEYPRYVTPSFELFDPLDLASRTEAIVCRDSMRKYTDFYCTGVYGGISTGYVAGCCLRCIFCWVDFSRDFPERTGKFYSPEKAFENLSKNAEKEGVKKMRISGGEPTLCRDHLLGLLDLIDGTGYLFILETNGILFGADEGYVRSLARYRSEGISKGRHCGGVPEKDGCQGRFL